MPVEPPPCVWEFPDPAAADESGVVAVGADLEPATLLAAYRHGIFPMRIGHQLAWWSPDPRGTIPLGEVHVSRSLHRSLPRFEIRVDTAFDEVMRACADPRRPHGWIDESFVEAYTRLFDMGWAHSFETWREGRLVGGLYGVAINGFFAGESMFYRETDASKAALVGAARWLTSNGFTLFDVQWTTPHLHSLGAVDVPRSRYLRLLADAVRLPPMETVTIFHNPRCSKSRGAMEILDARGVPHEVVEYLQAPPERATLERILDALADEPAALVRGDDAKKAGLDPASYTERDAVIDLLLAHPELMQRPVVMRGDRAVIGRPPESIEELLT